MVRQLSYNKNKRLVINLTMNGEKIEMVKEF
jgi:hypothetical protein